MVDGEYEFLTGGNHFKCLQFLTLHHSLVVFFDGTKRTEHIGAIYVATLGISAIYGTAIGNIAELPSGRNGEVVCNLSDGVLPLLDLYQSVEVGVDFCECCIHFGSLLLVLGAVGGPHRAAAGTELLHKIILEIGCAHEQIMGDERVSLCIVA